MSRRGKIVFALIVFVSLATLNLGYVWGRLDEVSAERRPYHEPEFTLRTDAQRLQRENRELRRVLYAARIQVHADWIRLRWAHAPIPVVVDPRLDPRVWR